VICTQSDYHKPSGRSSITHRLQGKVDLAIPQRAGPWDW